MCAEEDAYWLIKGIFIDLFGKLCKKNNFLVHMIVVVIVQIKLKII